MPINDFSRTLTKSTSQSITAEAIGHAEDISPIITNIDPESTFFLSRLSTDADATTLKFSWLTEGLKPPQVNAHLEKENYENPEKVGSLEGLENNIQKFLSNGYITDWQEKVKKVYDGSEISRELTNLYTRHAKDIEYAIVNNDTTNVESGSTPAMTGGIPYFMDVQNQSCTVETSGGVVTTTANHGLTTGDFVYFTASTMPTGLAANTMYYVRVASATTFTIFDTMKDAVENRTAAQVIPTTAGTSLKIVKNNVVSLGGATNFTLDNIDTVMQMAYNRGGNPTMAVMSPAKKKYFSHLVTAFSNVSINRDMAKGGRKLDLVADVLQTDFGVVTAEVHRMYPDTRIDLLDLNYWELKWFDKTHEINGLPKKGSYTEFFIESSLGLKATQPKASGSLINIKR